MLGPFFGAFLAQQARFPGFFSSAELGRDANNDTRSRTVPQNRSRRPIGPFKRDFLFLFLKQFSKFLKNHHLKGGILPLKRGIFPLKRGVLFCCLFWLIFVDFVFPHFVLLLFVSFLSRPELLSRARRTNHKKHKTEKQNRGL